MTRELTCEKFHQTTVSELRSHLRLVQRECDSWQSRATALSEEKEKMLADMEDGGHPILDHMDQVVGKLRQVCVCVCACVYIDVYTRMHTHKHTHTHAHTHTHTHTHTHAGLQCKGGGALESAEPDDAAAD